MQRVILHIDFDSFFASCEQQFDSRLRNIPIGVTATNGTPTGGACIIASSREAKVLGIKTASRVPEALEKCPTLRLVSADFVKYFEVSKKFLKICSDYSPVVEMFSIDELFMDITHSAHLFGGTFNLTQIIKTRIKKEIGEYITVSIGISHNKLLAKLASGFKKPNGLFEIKARDVRYVYKTAKLTDICGIGERIKLRLSKIGIYTLLQLRKTSEVVLIKEFGMAEGYFLSRVGQALDDSPVVSYEFEPEVKSVGRNYCLPKNQYDKRIVLQNIYELSEEVGIKLRRLARKAKTIGVRFHGNIEIHGQKTIATYIDSGREIFEGCLLFLGKDFMKSSNDYIRQISIWTSNLAHASSVPFSLFEYKNKNVCLQQTIDRLNDKFGDHTIRNGFLLYADKLTTVPNGYGADKWERTKLAKSF